MLKRDHSKVKWSVWKRGLYLFC